MTHRTGKRILQAIFCAAALYLLYFFRLDALGLVSTDEPRYAAIGREMALSGDWITPRLWGVPWFEKPALLYWMTALCTLAGLGRDLAPRVPVALTGASFLVLFYFTLRREWGARPAFFAAAILGSSAGWIAYSEVAVPDIPLAVWFNAALLLMLPWLRTGRRSLLPFAAALLGLAVLAKGLVPLVLMVPLLAFAGRRALNLLHPAVWLSFSAVALPWYLLCTLRNGTPFLETFFLQHQLGRFASTSLQHVQPWWFFVPVLLGCLFPWTPLLGLGFSRRLFEEPHARVFAAIALWGMLFFSLSTNKLPGYVVPLLPSFAALVGLGLHRAKFAAPWLALPILSLVWVPVTASVLPIALVSGLSKAWPVNQVVKFQAALLLLPLLLAAGLGFLAERAGHRAWAVAGIFGLTLAAVLWIKTGALPNMDPLVSARSTYQASAQSSVCLGSMPRAWRYGLNYYYGRALPDCGDRLNAKPLSHEP